MLETGKILQERYQLQQRLGRTAAKFPLSASESLSYLLLQE